MYIVVVGGGRVGYYLTRALLDEKHEVVLVEKDTAICDAINEELGSVCIRGDGSEVAILSDIGTNRADMLIAVTGDDDDNLVSCQIAKHHFKVPRTVARVVNPANANLFKKLGIDITVVSTNLILESIQAEVPTHPLTHLMTFNDRGLEIVDIKILKESSTTGKAIKDLALPPGTVLSLIIRSGIRPFVPSPDTILFADDQVIAATPASSEPLLRKILGEY
jgi:trk system potassium uptake protein TrkA